MSINLLLFKLTLIGYIAATVLYLVDVLKRKSRAGRFALHVLRATFVIHLASMLVHYLRIGYPPLTNLQESLSFFSWTVVAVYLLFDLRYRNTVLGAFLVPMALALLVFSGFAPRGGGGLNPVLQSWWLQIHVVLAFFGYAMFAMAFGAGVMYLLQERMLKSKKFSALYYRLPSLGTLDSINYNCLTFGFPLLTMAIISGAVWANSAWGGYWRWDPKETWALITWLVYAALLHGRLTIGWRGRRAAIFAIIGFCCVLFTFLGVNLLLTGEHTFKAFGGP